LNAFIHYTTCSHTLLNIPLNADQSRLICKKPCNLLIAGRQG
jgi:hypothetical protein